MALFRILWLRRWIRRKTNPIPVDRADLWKKRLSVGYMLVAWNAFGLVCYMVYKGKSDWAKYYGLKSEEELSISPGKQWAKILGIQNAKVYKVSGLNVTSEDLNDTVGEKEETDNINTKIN
ncbi:hypothetical protein NQ315_007210 [Exocentrus adspersus]|uniref:Uncharacterized protein n=1 Tax=Exocentrus adspersus TaxID=1586481 RepID=A0AAV8WCT0_9CUCU|nr:hypothetical protein NQ315_007210 [Exocentrus adspersus]